MFALFGTMVGFLIACAILGLTATRPGSATKARAVGIADPARQNPRRL